MLTPQFDLDLSPKLVVDIFAGGGGWSTAYEQATGQHVHIAINHDPNALSMHEANHPQTRHLIADVWEVNPCEATGGMPVGWLHLSPDCTDHSQAKGGQPRSRRIRALAWVGAYWSGTVHPDIIGLENVKQILKWGPLIAKRDKATGRVIKLSGGVAEPGERVPVENQHLIPDPKHAGRSWRKLVATWRSQGYVVEWRIIKACDYGAGTTRERLFAIARRDDLPIVWPEPTHAAKPKRGQKRFVVAADGIDFGIEGRSIFGRKRPLADATMRRIARGVKRYVLDCANPFLVQTGYGERHGQKPRTPDIQRPLGTVVAGAVKHAVVTPMLIQAGHGEGKPGGVQRWGDGALDIQKPAGTIHAGGGSFALATAYMMQANGGFNTTPGHDLRKPTSTITNTGSQQQLVAASLVHLRNHCDGRSADEPLQTISAGGEHHGLIECDLSPDDEAGALQVAAFLMAYYGTDQWGDLREPCATITTKDRLALVTVSIQGTPYVIVDIRLRMLTPRELYRLQGFPEAYIIEHGHDGRAFTKSQQVHMVGNSVSPPPAVALIAANAPQELQLLRRVA